MEAKVQEKGPEMEVRLPQPGQGKKEVTERYVEELRMMNEKQIKDMKKALEVHILELLKIFEDQSGLKVKEVNLKLGLTSSINSDPWLLQGVELKTSSSKGESHDRF
jgi:hypothetical protein